MVTAATPSFGFATQMSSNHKLFVWGEPLCDNWFLEHTFRSYSTAACATDITTDTLQGACSHDDFRQQVTAELDSTCASWSAWAVALRWINLAAAICEGSKPSMPPKSFSQHLGVWQGGSGEGLLGAVVNCSQQISSLLCVFHYVSLCACLSAYDLHHSRLSSQATPQSLLEWPTPAWATYACATLLFQVQVPEACARLISTVFIDWFLSCEVTALHALVAVMHQLVSGGKCPHARLIQSSS